MTFTPIAPTVHMPPSKIAADTYVVHQVQPALGQPLFVYLNSMVILGSEPVIVDTGTPANRDQWLEDVFSLVEPEDVRWVFLSHDDVDHSGNLDQVMTACRNAHLVCNWAMVERHSNCFDFPLERCRWVMHEESFSVGDRTLHAIRPPIYDSPTTRGLFDPKSGVYWAVDTFATLLPDPEMAVADLDPDFWSQGMAMFAFGGLSLAGAPRPRQISEVRRRGSGARHRNRRCVSFAGNRGRVHSTCIRQRPAITDARSATNARPVDPRRDNRSNLTASLIC